MTGMLAGDIVVTALLVVAGTFGLIGSIGLWKLQGPMQRLHAPTKASTVGVGAALLASVVAFALVRGVVTGQALLIAAFLFVTAPITALFLAKLHLHRTVDRSLLPPTGTGRDWATFDPTLEAAEPDLPDPDARRDPR